jgi:hypothetical protein
MQNNRGRYAALNISSISHLRKTMKKPYRVRWGNSDQNFEISCSFCSFSFISHCEEVVLRPYLDQSVLYQLVKESPKNHLLEKSISQNGKAVSN